MAITDLGLKELRERATSRFWETLGLERPPGRLGRVRAIGPSFAAKLANEGITSPSKLVDAAADEGDALALAANVDAHPKLVVRWGQLARLITSVDSLGIDGANLLDEARVNSIEALAGSDEDALTQLIQAVNEALSIVVTAPTKDDVARWIMEANA